MERYPEAVQELIEELKLLPGVGRRGAERMALALLRRPADELRRLGTLFVNLPDRVGQCPECGALAASGSRCGICASAMRDDALLCVVENMPQLLAIESSGNFNGRYLVLGGRLSPLDHEDGSNLNLAGLRRRLELGQVKEVILALGFDVEGRATAAFIGDWLKKYPVRVSQPALGLPAGANLSFADAATISAAFRGRIVQNEIKAP